ncbi:MAG: CRISPR-associated protein Csh1 [Saprospiraceae bacterium]|jgi:CRISPR-associated protein Csh1
MQDKAIIEIGKVKGEKKEKLYQNFIENMFPNKDYDMILAVFRFSKKGIDYTCDYEKIDIDKVGEKNYLKYAYRKGSARGGDVTITTKFGDIDKKFKNFYPKKVKEMQVSATEENEKEEFKIFQALDICLEKTENSVKVQLQAFYDSLGKVEQFTSGFTVRFEGLPGYEYLENFISIQKILQRDGTIGKSEKYKVVSEGYNNICSICMRSKQRLHGFASPFKYSTVDKTGMVSGFFDQKNNWKNYPICSDCALDFEIGKNYVAQHLSKYFYGKSYFIIPKIAVGSNPELLQIAINLLKKTDYKAGEGTEIATRENLLMRKIGQEERGHNQFSLNLLFYEENPTTKAIKIKLMLEEIFPSRFQELFLTVPDEIKKKSVFKGAMSVNKEKKDLEFNFAILKTFFRSDFYQIIQTVFLGTPLSEKVLFDKLMTKIRRVYIDQNRNKIFQYSNSYYTLFLSKELKWNTSLIKLAMMTITYLKELNIISKNKTTITMEIKDESIIEQQEKKPAFDIEKFNVFVEENKDFFDLDNRFKVGVFAVGVLVRQVFNLQSVNLDGNTPFEKKLKGYDLNPEFLKNIYREALDKINKYTKNIHSYHKLRLFINDNFILNSHKLNRVSNNELSFYFVAGLEFGNNFKTKK